MLQEQRKRNDRECMLKRNLTGIGVHMEDSLKEKDREKQRMIESRFKPDCTVQWLTAADKRKGWRTGFSTL